MMNNMEKNISVIQGIEDHVILRIPKQLRERVDKVIDMESDESIEVIHEADRDFIFKIGNEEYYATLRDLPTIVETHKTKNTEELYKSANVAQVLEVLYIMANKANRPVVDHNLDDGLTPAMKCARSERFPKVKPNVEEFQGADNVKLVKKLDRELCEIVEKLENSKGGAGEKFEHAEIVTMEHFMEYWDDVTEIKQGSDNFLTNSRLAYDRAYERYSENIKAHESRPLSATGASHTTKPNSSVSLHKSRSVPQTIVELPLQAEKRPASKKSSITETHNPITPFAVFTPDIQASPPAIMFSMTPQAGAATPAGDLSSSPQESPSPGESGDPSNLPYPSPSPYPSMSPLSSPSDLPEMSPSPLPAPSPVEMEESPSASGGEPASADSGNKSEELVSILKEIDALKSDIESRKKKIAEVNNIVRRKLMEKGLETAENKLAELERKRAILESS